MRNGLFALLLAGFLALFFYQVGAIAHWFYYTLMIIFSKIAFAIMFGIVALVVVSLVIYILSKSNSKN